eukprot:3262220-Amphidinium_carterae.1
MTEDTGEDGLSKQLAIERVKENGLELKHLAEELRSDRDIVSTAVRQNPLALKHAAAAMRRERDIVLDAVSQHGYALAYAAEELRRDRGVALTAVRQFGHALECAADELKADREIVLAAVSQAGVALEWAAEELKRDRHVVLAAIAQDHGALEFAADNLLEAIANGALVEFPADETLAAEVRECFYFFKVVTLSGRSCVVALWGPPHPLYGVANKSELLRHSCKKLGLEHNGSEKLVYGSELVPDTDVSRSWPGSPSLGSLITYQL